ncbi:MAG: methyltransferase domain-containing protein [Alphaproteobacteria bacterium]|nr:methyltransferase domain-containing protein [Alphaproteobacteria bacterium]
MTDLPHLLRSATCPACGHHVAVPFLTSAPQPLATLAWPESAAEAAALPRLKLDFVRCVDCGHVFNAAFDYAVVPYRSKPNRMFNRGSGWSKHLDRVRALILRRLPRRPVVVEIGHGDGGFLEGLGASRPSGRYFGFDPHGRQGSTRRNVTFRRELFLADQQFPALRPDLIITRHVLEHLTNPLGFIQALSFAATWLKRGAMVYLEVPCVDRAVATGRTADFYYEHNSQFTTLSFRRMLSRSGADIDYIGHGYDGEVVFGFVKLGGSARQKALAGEARRYDAGAMRAQATIADQLDDLARAKRRVAVWGGTGKSAAFMHRYAVDARRFPIVIDSDQGKVGTFVPGTGQAIRHATWLKTHPIDVVIIPPQWRAADILAEIAGLGLQPATVLIEHKGRLVDYFRASHPYPRPHRRKSHS